MVHPPKPLLILDDGGGYRFPYLINSFEVGGGQPSVGVLVEHIQYGYHGLLADLVVGL